MPSIHPRTDLTGARQGLFRLRSADGIVPFYRRHGHAPSFFTSDLPFLSFHPPVFNPFLSIPLVAALPFSAVRPRGIGFFSFHSCQCRHSARGVSEKSSSPAVERIFPYRPWRMSTATFQGRKIIPAAANGPKKGK